MKKILPVVIVMTLLLTACGAASAPSASATPVKVPTLAISPTPVLTPAITVTPLPGGCAVVPLMPVPNPMFPAPAEGEYTQGPATALITFIEYADFQCPYCSQLSPYLKDIMAANPDDVRLVYRYFPLTGHALALISSQAAEAAARQGKFWEMHDLLFAKQADWTNLTSEASFTDWVISQATIMGLDAAKFASDLTDPAVVQKIADAQTAAESLGLPGTPFLMANGLYVGEQVDEATLTYVVGLIKSLKALEARTYQECPPLTIDKTRQYIATLNTTKGDIVIQLYPDKAPIAVNSFVFLAQNGWYDGDPFHRVIKDLVAQSGDPTGYGRGNPGYVYINEISDLKFDKDGVVGVANMGGPNSNGSQFFITFGAQPHLDGIYTIMGQVIQGMDVVKSLTVRDPSTGVTLPDPDKIIKVTIEVK
jgi:cyclophilin family peptidyl-prolyl cis-trans isomerase/protein-disulfide isomerase